MNAPFDDSAVLAGITFFVAVLHLVVWARHRARRSDLYFGLACLSVALYETLVVAQYAAGSLELAAPWQRAAIAFLTWSNIALIWFVAEYTGHTQRPVVWSVSAWCAVSGLLALTNPGGVWFVEGSGLSSIGFAPGPMAALQGIVGAANLLYMAWAGIRLYRSGQRARAAPLVVALAICGAAVANDSAVWAGLWTFPYTIEYAFTALVVIVAYGLSSELVDAAETKEALLESEERLRQAQKLESIGRLAGGIAHDFNNLLTPILGYAETHLELSPPASQVHEDLIEVRRAAQGAADLTRQLLAFGRKQVLEVRVLDLNETISSFEAILRRLIREDIEIRFRLDPAAGNVRADEAQVQQVLMNLVVNARDAMPLGGRVTIATRNVDLDDDYVQYQPEAQPGPHVMLSVRDEGGGIDPETIDRIFEPFFTTKESGRGTGLGLATVHGIAVQHSGHVTVRSKPGKGATFMVFLPRVHEEARPAPVQPIPSTPVTGHETILLVEDADGVRRLAWRILEQSGFNVLVAANPDEALAISHDHDGVIDLLVSDVILPRINGRTLYLLLAEERPKLRVLYMSGYAEEVVGDHGVLDAPLHFLPKPFSKDSLTRKVREVLDSGR